MCTLDTKENKVPQAAQETEKAGNKQDTHAAQTPPRKAPAARDKLKPLAMPKALKI
jgi:hypothetical protein